MGGGVRTPHSPRGDATVAFVAGEGRGMLFCQSSHNRVRTWLHFPQNIRLRSSEPAFRVRSSIEFYHGSRSAQPCCFGYIINYIVGTCIMFSKEKRPNIYNSRVLSSDGTSTIQQRQSRAFIIASSLFRDSRLLVLT